MKRNLILLFAIIANTYLLNGCLPQPFSEYYKPRITEELKQELISKNEIIVLDRRQEPILIITDDIEDEEQKALSKGYIPIGYSSFTGYFYGFEQAKEHAAQIGALLVIAKVGDKTTKQGEYYVPVETETTSTTQGKINNKKFTATTKTKETTTQTVNYTRVWYDQFASYYVLRNIDKIKLGIILANLSQEQKIAAQRNIGVSAYVIIENTPAYFANVLPGDVIIELNGEQVIDVQDFEGKIDKIADSSKNITLKIIRNGQEKLITATRK